MELRVIPQRFGEITQIIPMICAAFFNEPPGAGALPVAGLNHSKKHNSAGTNGLGKGTTLVVP